MVILSRSPVRHTRILRAYLPLVMFRINGIDRQSLVLEVVRLAPLDIIEAQDTDSDSFELRLHGRIGC
jgi:hypothetical protein